MLRSTIRCLPVVGLISSLVEKAIKIQISTKKWAGGTPGRAASQLHKKVGETEPESGAQDQTEVQVRPDPDPDPAEHGSGEVET